MKTVYLPCVAALWLCLSSLLFAQQQPSCEVIATECKSPPGGGALSAECIALRQRCDPYFDLAPGLALPGSEAATIQPEVAKRISPNPYQSTPETIWQQSLPPYWANRVSEARYPWAAWWTLHRGARWLEELEGEHPVPFPYLAEPGRSGFTDNPVEEDFLFFWRTGMYPPYGGGQNLPPYSPSVFHPVLFGD